MPSSGTVQKDRKKVAFIKETSTLGGQVRAVRHQATSRFANFVAHQIYGRSSGQLQVKYNTQMYLQSTILIAESSQGRVNVGGWSS